MSMDETKQQKQNKTCTLSLISADEMTKLVHSYNTQLNDKTSMLPL